MMSFENESGCCPVCARQVPRLLAVVEGRTRELYACPQDGTIAYGSLRVPLARWVAGFPPGAAAA